jgi:hypothetical protein
MGTKYIVNNLSGQTISEINSTIINTDTISATTYLNLPISDSISSGPFAPGSAVVANDTDVDINFSDGVGTAWSFSPTGITFPDDTIQTTAYTGGAASVTLYLLEAHADVTYTLPGSFTEDPCRYSIVNNTVNVPSGWFNTSTYRFTPQRAGYWEITATYDVYRNTEASLAIKKNTDIVAAAGSFDAVAQQITKIVYLNGSTDYISIINVGGASLSRAQYDSRSWFQARWVG